MELAPAARPALVGFGASEVAMERSSSPRPESAEAIVSADSDSIEPASKRSSITFVLARSALLAGLCRFVPVPLLDDYLETNVHRFMIASLLERANRGYHVTHVEALYRGVGDWFAGCVGWLVRMPVTLVVKLLKKAFKSVFVVLLIREAGLSMATALLLGHVVHRALERGAFQDSDDPAARDLRAEAEIFRAAFDAAFAGTDRRFIGHLLATVFREVRRLPKLGSKAVRVMFGRKAREAETVGALPERAEPVVEQGIEHVRERLEREEVKSFIADFERLFDSALAHQVHLEEARSKVGAN